MLVALSLTIALAHALLVDEKSDLNVAISAAISAMSADGFLSDTYVQFFGPPARAVKACAVLNFPRESLIELDSDLARVLRSGVARVGFATLGLSVPILFKTQDGSLDGYEPTTATEAFRRIGEQYGRAISVQFVEIGGATFFDPLAAALARRRVDVVWSRAAVLDSRALVADFTCSSFSSTNALVSVSDDVTSFEEFVALGAAANDPVEVGCVKSSNFCLVTLPSGFVFNDTFANTAALQAALADGRIDFAVINGEQIAFDVAQGTYEGVNIHTFSDIALAPCTRRVERPIEASTIVDTAVAHAGDVRAEIASQTLKVKTAEAIAAHVSAAEARYQQLCAFTTRHSTCAAAVGDAFDQIKDAFSDKSVSDGQSDISDDDDDSSK